MRVDQLVRELGVRLGLPLALDGNGMCRLVFNGGMNVDVEALRDDGEKFIIYSVLSKLRPGPRGALYQALLEANQPTEDGAVGVLALDVERDEVLLQRVLDASSLNAVYLSEIVDKFVEMAVSWTERIERFDQRTLAKAPLERGGDNDELGQGIYHPRA
jgi:Tir chaperone protein (CesT) family